VQPPSPQVPPLDVDSFVDPSDTEGLQAAVAAENQRLLARRRGVPQLDQSVLSAVRRPPHAEAREAAEAMAELDQLPRQTGVTATGVEVFAMPPEEINSRRPDPKMRVPINQVQGPGSKNPRFKPPAKG
jgi:hypothetical protein